MIVKLRRTKARYRGLTPGPPYVVIGIEADDFRILNDAGRPYLYAPGLFKILDSREARGLGYRAGRRWTEALLKAISVT
jgi:hypothetical protein